MMSESEIPLLSVAVITYKQEQYIAQTLDSILSQKHDYSYEIVIGEDCSPDGTRKIVEEYAARYPDIIKPLYNSPNLGIIGNYFNVLSHCSGKYVMECAGDDFWLPGKVQTQLQYMESHPEVTLCTGNVLQCDENGQQSGSYEVNPDNLTFENLFRGNAITAVTVCFRKTIFDAYVETVNPQSRSWLMEDLPFWLYVAHEGTIQHIPQYVAMYRLMTGSESHCDNPEKQRAFRDSCRSVRAFYAELFNAQHLYEAYIAEEAKHKENRIKSAARMLVSKIRNFFKEST